MKHTLMRRAFAPMVALAVVGTLAACSDTEAESDGHDMGHGGSSSAPPADAPFNAADVMFAQMMIPHHEQAMEMADVLLATSEVDPVVVELAEEIKAAQGPEIDTLTGWLDEWGAAPASDQGHGTMDGMMSADDMAALDAAEGAEAQRLFLEQMVVHHEGAVEMAAAEIEDGRFPAAIEMAEAVVETQNAEIRSMQDLLAAS